MSRNPQWRIEWHDTLPSTMDRAAELAEVGAPAGTVVVADYQSAGRGTRGRVWIAPAKSCLMFTLLARPKIPAADLERLPARIGTSIATALRTTFELDCTVKPPNDVMVSGRKLCGVLCTSRVIAERVEWVLCGVGLNTAMRVEELPMPTATSLMCEGISPPPHEVLLEVLLTCLAWLCDA